MSTDGDTLDPVLAEWVATTLGGPIRSVARTPSGGSRLSFFVAAGPVGGPEIEAVLRVEAGGSFTGTEVNVSREATVYRALADTPVPVPRVLGLAPGGAALLLERLTGTSDLGAGDDEREATLDDFIDVVAALHRLDVDTLDLGALAVPQDAEDHARIDLALWRHLADTGVPDLDPLLAYAGAYLYAHPPASVAKTCLVQGDTGPGNFVAAEGRVTGLIDMEFAHVGDPMDDIAWIAMRAFGPGPGRLAGDDAARLLDRYTARSGIPVDERSVAYYAVAVQYRCGVTTSLAAGRGGGARGWAPYLLVTQRYLQGVAATLSAYTGVTEPPLDLPDPPPTPRTIWYDRLLDGIREAVRAIDDDARREHTRNQQILVHHLRAHDRAGADLQALDRADRSATGLDSDDPDDEALRAAATAAGAAGDPAVLGYLLRRAQRQRALWATLLDRPAR